MHAVIHARPFGHENRGIPVFPTAPRKCGILVGIPGIRRDGWEEPEGLGRDVLEGGAGFEGGEGDWAGGGVGAEVGEDGGAEGGVGGGVGREGVEDLGGLVNSLFSIGGRGGNGAEKGW